MEVSLVTKMCYLFVDNDEYKVDQILKMDKV